MAYLVMFHGGWLVGSALLGLAMGWIAVVQRGRGVPKRGSLWLAALAALLVAAAIMHLVPGRAGYWLDLGLVMLGCYLAGCTLGSALRAWTLSRSIPGA